jgi:hypothetical protein
MNELLAYFDAQLAIQSLQFGAGLLMAITAAEILFKFQTYAKSGVLSWELGRRTNHIYNNSFFLKLGDFFYQENRFFALFVIRLLLGLGMVACSLYGILSPPLLAAALLTSLLVLFRASQGHDGSFQLRLLMLSVLFSCSISPFDSLPFRLGLYFLSAQLVLSYLLAGIAKLRGATWRDGTALIGIFGTIYHGVGWVYKLLNTRTQFSLVLSWFVIGFEILFPLVLLGNGWVVVGFLAITTLFHLSTSFLMGLNGFFLSFLAAYPALIYCLGKLPWATW